jgi:hypothetical protein
LRAKTISLRNTIVLSAVVLLVLAEGCATVFLGLAWSANAVSLPEFLTRRSIGASAPRLIVTVIPEGASITVNQRPYDPQGVLQPGDYVVAASAEGYYTAEETVHIKPDESTRITIRLVPIPSIQIIAGDATAPGWDRQGELFFLNRSQSRIQKWAGNAVSPGVAVEGEIYQILYLPDGTYAVILAGQGVDSADRLYAVNFKTGESTDLPVTGHACLGQDGKTIWGIYEDPGQDPAKPLWRLSIGGSPRPVHLENPQYATDSSRILIDPSGKWLAAEGGKGIAVWEISGGEMVATFENASAPVWIQTPNPGLAYLNSDGSLYFARADLKWGSTFLLANIQHPIAGMPGGSDIIFGRYNPFAGGTSFWAVDAETAGVRLLSEASVESGRAAQFAVSFDRKKIAFVNEQNVLYLVVLAP